MKSSKYHVNSIATMSCGFSFSMVSVTTNTGSILVMFHV